MKPTARILATAIVIAFLRDTVLADTASENLRRFDQVWREMRDRFYDPNMHGLDWEAVGKRHRPRAEKASTPNELQQAINGMLAELKASHLHYSIADDFDYWAMRTVFMPDERPVAVAHIGVQGVQEGETFIVRAIMEGGPAAKAGIRSGDRLFGLDGRPFSTVGTFRSREGETVRLKVERAGKETAVEVRPVKETPIEAYSRAVSRSVKVIERDGKRLGYVHLWVLFHASVLRAFEEAMQKLGATDGLILDLRDGFGGSPDRFDYPIFRPGLAITTIPRSGPSSTERKGYGGPVVALINGGSRSAKEYFAYELKKSGRATLVGTKTMGAFLGAGGVKIADDGILMVPIVDLRLDGKRLEGVGVTPHVEVDAVNSYGPGDAQLSKGLDLLLEKVRSQPRDATILR